MKKIILSIICLILLSGCWNYRELNEMEIVTGFAIEKSDIGIKLSAQIMDVGQMGKEQQDGNSTFVVLETEGRTFFEALRKMTKESPRKLYISHVEIVIIDEEVAKEGIADWSDFIIRDHEFRTEFRMVIAKDAKASDILKAQVPLDDHNTHKIDFSIESNSSVFGIAKILTFDEFISDLLEIGKNPLAVGVTLIGDEEIASKKENLEQTEAISTVSLVPFAVFKEDKLVGWLTQDESIGYNFATNNIESTILSVPCEGGYLGIETIRSSGEISTEYKNGELKGKVEIKVLGTLGEVNCNLDVEKVESIDRVISITEKYVESLIFDSVDTSKKYASDIFGFGESLHKSDYKSYDKFKDNWDSTYVNIPIEIEVKVDIQRTGVIVGSVEKEVENEKTEGKD